MKGHVNVGQVGGGAPPWLLCLGDGWALESMTPRWDIFEEIGGVLSNVAKRGLKRSQT